MSIAYSVARSTMGRIYNTFLQTPPVLERATFFPEAQQFDDAWPELRSEALSFMDSLESVPRFHELMPEQYQLSSHGNREWRMLVLRAYGLNINENLQRCPTLARLLEGKPHITSASLSFLAPGKKVPTHTGPFRGITRYYLGLEVPTLADGRPGVELTIAGQAYRLGGGDSLLWDDTYPHRVSNETDHWRIALLLDVYRANMPAPLRLFTDGIIGVAKMSIKWRKVFPEEFA